MDSRRQLGYPPFTRLALVRLSGPVDEPVAREARRLAAALENLRTRDARITRPGAASGAGPGGSHPPPGPVPLANAD